MVEKADVGIALGNELVADGLRDVQALKVRGNKVERMALQCAKIEDRQVRLPQSAPWLDQFLTEVGEFPNSKYDDQVDTMSQMLATLDRKPWQLRGKRPPLTLPDYNSTASVHLAC